MKGGITLEKYIYGVDLGGTTVKMGMFDSEGNVQIGRASCRERV